VGRDGCCLTHRGETDFAGCKLIAVNLASHVEVQLALLVVVDPA
jgi:hypothetical protein